MNCYSSYSKWGEFCWLCKATTTTNKKQTNRFLCWKQQNDCNECSFYREIDNEYFKQSFIHCTQLLDFRYTITSCSMRLYNTLLLAMSVSTLSIYSFFFFSFCRSILFLTWFSYSHFKHENIYDPVRGVGSECYVIIDIVRMVKRW